jgi:hypothetical protein
VIIQGYDVQVVHQQEFQGSSAGIVTRITPRIGHGVTMICNFQFDRFLRLFRQIGPGITSST